MSDLWSHLGGTDPLVTDQADIDSWWEKTMSEADNEEGSDETAPGTDLSQRWSQRMAHLRSRTASGEPENIETARRILATQTYEEVDGVLFDHFSASAVVQIYDALNPENAAKFGALPLTKMVDVAFKLINKHSVLHQGEAIEDLPEGFEENIIEDEEDAEELAAKGSTKTAYDDYYDDYTNEGWEIQRQLQNMAPDRYKCRACGRSGLGDRESQLGCPVCSYEGVYWSKNSKIAGEIPEQFKKKNDDAKADDSDDESSDEDDDSGDKPKKGENPFAKKDSARHTATEVKTAKTCADCGAKIERDPEGEENRSWHHDDGSTHDHEAKPSGGDDDTKESRRRTAWNTSDNGFSDASRGIPARSSDPGYMEGYELGSDYARLRLKYPGTPGSVYDLQDLEGKSGARRRTAGKAEVEAWCEANGHVMKDFSDRLINRAIAEGVQILEEVSAREPTLKEDADRLTGRTSSRRTASNPYSEGSPPWSAWEEARAGGAQTGTELRAQHQDLFSGADQAYDREDRGWFEALSTEDLLILWDAVANFNFINMEGPWDDEVYDALADKGHKFSSKESRRKTAISLTNVGIDGPGVGIGTDPSGARVKFKLSDKDESDLKAVLYSDLNVNFSGVSVDESDIIKGSSRKQASNYYLDLIEDSSGDLVDILYYHNFCAPPELKAKGGWPAPEWPDYSVYCEGCGEIIHEGSDHEGARTAAKPRYYLKDTKNNWRGGNYSDLDRAKKALAEAVGDPGRWELWDRQTNERVAARHGTGDPGGAWAVQFAGVGEQVWSGNGITFDTPEEAKSYAQDKLMSWTGADMGRVVPAGTPTHDKADWDPNDPQIVINYRTGARRKQAERSVSEIAQEIQRQDFDHCFTLSADGTITDADNIYAPEVYHDDTNDIDIQGSGWNAITGLTGQYGYSGAVMHASEYIGDGVARVMLEMVEDGPRVFAIVAVSDMNADVDNGEDDLVGWAIVYRDAHSGARTAGSKSDECPKCGAKTDPVVIGDTLKAECTSCGWKGTKKKSTRKQARKIREIAQDIYSDWTSVNYGAVPYLEAMRDLESMSDMYGSDPASMIVSYFLSNSGSWRGPKAKEIKAELKAMLANKGGSRTSALDVHTWADGFGIWHARVSGGDAASQATAARDAIISELSQRENIDPAVIGVEQVGDGEFIETLTREGTRRRESALERQALLDFGARTAARSDYAHHNEDADAMWWAEEGSQHAYDDEPDEDPYDEFDRE